METRGEIHNVVSYFNEFIPSPRLVLPKFLYLFGLLNVKGVKGIKEFKRCLSIQYKSKGDLSYCKNPKRLLNCSIV